MKKFIIQEKFVGYADITIEAETEDEAIALYNRGYYKDSNYDLDDMTYDHEFSDIREESEFVEPEPEVFSDEEKFVNEVAKGIVENDMSGVLEDYGSKVDALVDSMSVTVEKESTVHRRKDLDSL